jgi:hypothetical protein
MIYPENDPYRQPPEGAYYTSPYFTGDLYDPESNLPNYGIPAPVVERSHSLRNRVIATVAAVAAAGAGVGLWLSGGNSDARHVSKAPAAVGKPHPRPSHTTQQQPTTAPAPEYNPTACVSEVNYETVLNLTCAEAGFGAELTPAVYEDLGAVVTLNVSVETPAEKKFIASKGGAANGWDPSYLTTGLTGARVDYNGKVATMTAGHADEVLSDGSCAGNGVSTVVAGGSAQQQGYDVNLTGIETSYTSEGWETSNDPDVATIMTSGSNEDVYNELPVLSTELDAKPQIGDVFYALTEEPQYGDDHDQEQDSIDPSQRSPRVIKLVYAGQDPFDSNDGVFIPLGSAVGIQGQAIGGASGSAIVTVANGTDEAMLVRAYDGPDADNNENPGAISGPAFAAEYGILPVDRNNAPEEVQPIIGQFLPSENNTPVTECK